MACLARVFDTGQPETLYFSYPGPAGTRQWEARAMLEPAMPGDPASVLVVSRDITQRQEIENRRLAAQRLFEAVFQSAPEAMSLGEWDSGRLLLVNDAFCTLFGRSRESLIGRTAVELGLWGSAGSRQQLLEALARGERVRDAAGVSTRPDGQPIEVRYSAERVQVDGHDGLLLLFRDVTQAEKDQRALARSELRFRLAAEHGQVWEWDLDAPPPSEAFYTALGYPATPPQEPPRALSALIHPQDLPALWKTLKRFLLGRADFRLELRARDARDRYRWFEVRGSGQRNAQGRVTYMAGTVFEISDRKELEAAQRQTLTQLDAVANASPALFWTTDIHKQPNWLNKAWLAFTGRDLVSECDAFWLDDLHPLDRERCARVFNTAFDAREPYSMEYRLLRHDGQYRWVLEQGMPRHDADQRFIGYVGSCLDVTDLRQAEATALERGAILEQVFAVLRDMLFVLDRNERFVHFQAGSHDRLLLHPDEFMGRLMGDLMPPALVRQLREAMARAREGGPQELDYSLELPGGLSHFNARLAWLPGGEQCMFFVRDTTEQQKHLQERERTSQFVLLLFGLASRFINLPLQQMDLVIHDALGDLGRFVGADRAALFSHEAGTDTHVWCADDLPAGLRHRARPPQAPEVAGATALGRDGMVCVSDVDALPESEFKSSLQTQGVRSLVTLPLSGDQDGASRGFVTLESVRHTHTYDDEDITLLKLFAQMLVNVQARSEAQARLRELTGQLEMKVADRTAQLEESVRRLQVVNRELESFTYSASHDLRTPLRGIEGFCSLLLEEHASQLDDQGRAYLQRIQKATLHMSQLVSDLLAYSRLQQLTEQREPVAVAACVQEVVVPFRDEMEARQSRLSLQVPDDLTVLANAKGLAIVLRNLIDNALKFTPRAKRRTSASRRRFRRSGCG
jgi:PAS domain S-box-containing protein